MNLKHSLVDAYREDISVYKYCYWYSNFANQRNKRPFVSTSNEAVIGTLMTIGDVNDMFPMCNLTEHIFVGTDTIFVLKVNTGPLEQIRKSALSFLAEEKAKVRKNIIALVLESEIDFSVTRVLSRFNFQQERQFNLSYTTSLMSNSDA